MRILVTGGSGFIASYFYEPLRAAGHDMVNLDLVDPSEQAKPYRYVKGDVRDRATLVEAMKGCEAVLHLAAAHHDFGIERDTYFSVNERGTRLITEVMDEVGVRDIAFYSTVAVYGDAPEPHHEDAPKVPVSPYGQSKLKGEEVLQEWVRRAAGRRALVIRPTVTFGPRNFANMYSLIRQISKGRALLVGDGSNIKSLSYVENIVDATCQLWGASAGSSAATGSRVTPVGPGFHVYNYIDKPDFTSRQIMETIYRALGKNGPKIVVPMWAATLGAMPFDMVIALTGKNLPVSSARIKKLFAAQTKFEADKILEAGYKPKVPLGEGIAKMTRWYAEQGRFQSPAWNVPPAEAVPA